MFLDMMKNKEQMLQMLLSDINACSDNAAAFSKLETLYANGRAVSQEHAMAAFAKSLRHTNETLKRTLITLTVYVAGDNFTSDSAKVAMKLGKGQEALQAMFAQKMGGRT